MPVSNVPSRYESRLIQKLKQGDRDAFEVIFSHYNQPLIDFARRELKADELVDDVVQDVFVKLWTYRENLKPDLSIKGFLFTCLKNRILNAIRTQKNIILKHSKFVQGKDYFAAPADNALIIADYGHTIDNFISKAPKKKQRVLELSMQGYSNKEISDQVNLSVNTVKTYLGELRRSIKSLVLDPKSSAMLLLIDKFIS